MDYVEDDLAELRTYARAWDAESAAEEIELDRTAQAYEAGMLVPVEDAEPPATVPLSAFLAVVLIGLVLVVTVLWVG